MISSKTKIGAWGVIAVMTLLAILQPLRPDPLRVPSTFTEWFWYPMEVNSFRRLPFVRSDLRAVTTLAGGDLVWAVGTGGTIVLSDDGGSTWTSGQMIRPAAAPSAARPRLLNNLNSVYFSDEEIGWVGGDGVILKTTDGGQNWATVPRGAAGGVFGLAMSANGDGFAASSDGIRSTFDGGNSWQLGLLREPLVDVVALRHGAATLGFDHRVHLSQDGKNWKDASALIRPLDTPIGPRVTAIASVDTVLYVALLDPTGAATSAEEPSTSLGVARSLDGGKTWRTPKSAGLDGAQGPVRRARFVTPEIGWIATDGGALLRTLDGGNSWQPLHTQVVDVAFADPRNGYAITPHHSIIRTTDGGLNWRRVSGGNAFRAVQFMDDRTGVVVGDGGLVATTRDGGRRWDLGRSSTRADLHSVAFFDRMTGWAAGPDSTILHTDDGGTTWRSLMPVPSGRAVRAIAVEAPTAGRSRAGYVVTDSGDVFSISDWEPWQEIGVIPDSAVRGLYLADAAPTWAHGGSGIWRSSDRGRTWRLLAGGDFSAAHFPSGSTGWAARKDWVLRTRDGGERWDSARIERDGQINSIRFADYRTGWAVGQSGGVWSTVDGGASWRRLTVRGLDTTASAPDLHALSLSGDSLAWAVGEGGVVVSGNAADSWSVIVRPASRMPAPWYWTSLTLCAIAIGVAQRRVPAQQVVGVHDIFVSDRALRPGDPDLLGFEDVARGLSRFLRNKGTEPPLTLAITGEWGRGKSSLMSLIKDDLRSHHQRVVWFNAWDHENEESILASLLVALQEQAVPGFMQPISAVAFRLRLVWHRLFADTASTSARVAVLALLVVVTVILSAPTHFLQLAATATGLLDALATPDALQRWMTGLERSVAAAGTVGFVLLLSSGITFVVAAGRAARAFGVKPGSLLAPITRAATLRDLNATAGFRHHFAADLRAVTSALSAQRLVLIIDDLDRCRPEGIRTVLETINFLGQSGDCLIVLGMDRDVVWRAMFRHFLAAATAAGDEPGTSRGGKPPAEEAQSHADAFFDKLINIEVRLAPPARDQVATLITETAGAPAAPSEVARAQRRRNRLRRVLNVLAVGAVAVAATRMVLSSPDLPPPPASSAAAPTGGTAEARRQTPVRLPGPSAVYRPVDPSAVRPDIPSRAGALVPAPSVQRRGLWLLVLVSALVLIALLHVLLRRDDIIVDSPRFRRALDAWAPLLSRQIRTPRAAKRFLNRLRYYVMIAGDSAPSPRQQRINSLLRHPWIAAARRAAGYLPPAEEVRPETIPEHILVALAAVEALDREILTHPASERLRDFTDYLTNQFGVDDTWAIRALGYETEIQSHVPRFLALSGTVHTG